MFRGELIKEQDYLTLPIQSIKPIPKIPVSLIYTVLCNGYYFQILYIRSSDLNLCSISPSVTTSPTKLQSQTQVSYIKAYNAILMALYVYRY